MTDQGDEQQGEQVHEWGEAVPASSGRPKPGDIITESGLAMAPGPLVGQDVSTPLEEDETEHTIPPGPLWAMKERRHTNGTSCRPLSSTTGSASAWRPTTTPSTASTTGGTTP